MFAARHEQRDALARMRGSQLPRHLELLADLREPLLERRACAREVVEVNLHSQEKAAALGIGRVLVGLDDVRACLGQAGGHRRDDPVPVGACDEQPRDVVRCHGFDGLSAL